MATIRYTDKPYGGHGLQRDDWRIRFPSHSRPMDSAPTMGSRPIRLFEPSGQSRWGVHHLGCWREVERVRDPRTGAYTVRMSGALISNPIRWASS
jgi:hypothetical protein